MVPKPNPGKTGDDKNEHYDNETFFSDQSGPSEAAHAYGHGVVRDNIRHMEYVPRSWFMVSRFYIIIIFKTYVLIINLFR